MNIITINNDVLIEFIIVLRQSTINIEFLYIKQ